MDFFMRREARPRARAKARSAAKAGGLGKGRNAGSHPRTGFAAREKVHNTL